MTFSYNLLRERTTDQKYLKQEYTYNHFLTSEHVTENYSKSGNPGYIVGKPVISGYLVKNEEQQIKQNLKTLTV